MHTLHLSDKRSRKLRVLCLGAHGDDIEMGCGGTILRLQQEYPNIDVQWVVFSCTSHPHREREARASARAFLPKAKKCVAINDFRDGFFPFLGAAIKEYFDQLKMQLEPDVIFTHHSDDLHQDHRLISSLTWNTFRDHLILEYEICKYDGRMGMPNLFIPLDRSLSVKKAEHLLRHYQSQKTKHWFTKDVFLSMLRLRGLECNAPSGYAEAFYGRKLVL
jgi:LmbE family N-acetylglucosaminyl deacetylase